QCAPGWLWLQCSLPSPVCECVGGGAIMAWGAFSFSGTMELQEVQGGRMATGYVQMLQRASLMTEGPLANCQKEITSGVSLYKKHTRGSGSNKSII
uniref:Uncharacterized protein n=1 Tax=Maylandia zebra TaxID=106582 RepID=A0A3P9ATR2_9CICH